MDLVDRYYAAWTDRAGDMSDVPLAEDFAFTGPVASFDTAAGFRAMARDAGAAVRGFTVRSQFANGDRVCSIVDWEMDLVPGRMTAAEILEVRDGKIVRSELIYDAEPLRRAMAFRQEEHLVSMIDRAVDQFRNNVSTIRPADRSRPTPCTQWNVGQLLNHAYWSLDAMTRLVEGSDVDWGAIDPDRAAGEFEPLLARIPRAWRRPGMWQGTYAFVTGPSPAAVVANITLLELSVHGWDAARAVGRDAGIDGELAAAVDGWARQAVTDRGDNFAPEVPVGGDADATARLVAFLGRTP